MALISTGTTYGSVGALGGGFAPTNVIGTSRVGTSRVVSGAPVMTSAPYASTYAASPYMTSAPYASTYAASPSSYVTSAAPRVVTSAPIITQQPLTLAAPQMIEIAEPTLIETISAPPAEFLPFQNVQQQGSAVPFPTGPLPAVACRVEGVGSSVAYNDLRQQRDASQSAFWSMRQQEAPQTFQIAASSGAAGPIEEGFAVTGGFAPNVIQSAPMTTYMGGGFAPNVIQSAPMTTYMGGATFAQPGLMYDIAAPTMIEQIMEPGFVVDTFGAPTMVEVVDTFAAPTVMETFVQPTMIA